LFFLHDPTVMISPKRASDDATDFNIVVFL
jgi:hypothetical protein